MDATEVRLSANARAADAADEYDNAHQSYKPPLVDLGEAMVERFLANFDPLARLEAEYAAVVAQSASASNDDNSSTTQHALGKNSSEAEEIGEGGGGDHANAPEEYALLPAASPTSSDGGEYYQLLGDASDEEEEEDDSNTDSTGSSHPEGAVAPAPTLGSWDAATRENVMASMQRMQLAPPPWAKSTALSDEELVALVQQRLQE
ncbi:hypothetical protein FI667_g13636, partial [Globisporangium splendens]